METLANACQYVIPLFIVITVAYGYYRRVPVYDSFITGAKDGLGIITGIFPYVLAIFIMVKTLQASGAQDYFQRLFAFLGQPFAIPGEVFSVAMIKPFSNAATLSLFTELLKATGPDSTPSLMAAVIMGSAETTFYVLAVYLGAVGIRKTRYLVPVCLTADLIGIFIAIAVVKALL